MVSGGHDSSRVRLDSDIPCSGSLSCSLGPWVGFACGDRGLDLRRQLAKRQWQRVTWRLLLIAVPIAILSWRPEVDPDPDRWGYFQLGLFVAYLQAGDVDAAIDVLDDARADPAQKFQRQYLLTGRSTICLLLPSPGGG